MFFTAPPADFFSLSLFLLASIYSFDEKTLTISRFLDTFRYYDSGLLEIQTAFPKAIGLSMWFLSSAIYLISLLEVVIGDCMSRVIDLLNRALLVSGESSC